MGEGAPLNTAIGAGEGENGENSTRSGRVAGLMTVNIDNFGAGTTSLRHKDKLRIIPRIAPNSDGRKQAAARVAT